MEVGILYFLIVIFSNALGSLSGMGGGIIIKPIFDLVSVHTIVEITFYSSVAVFTMAVVSVWRQLSNGLKIDLKVAIATSIGAFFGGVIGNVILNQLIFVIKNPDLVLLIQIVLTIITLIISSLYIKYQWRQYQITSVFWYLMTGVLLGVLGSLLGIGGGPINVTLLIFMFAIPVKEATVYSIIIILVSQFSKLTSVFFTTGFQEFDLNILYFIIPAAIGGGFLGARLSNIFSSEKVSKVFQYTIGLIIALNIYNGIQIFI